MTASLPMYETAAMTGSLDRFWAEVRTRYGKGPKDLDRGSDPHDTWRDPHLVLSQTCGLPYRTELFDKVQLVATPDYGLPHCPAGYYVSHLIVRRGDARTSLHGFHGARLARNDIRSQSGWAATVTHLEQETAGIRLADDVIHTGSHRNSIRAVAQGAADIASIDAVTWALLHRDTDETKGLRILTSTEPTPGLPLIAGPSQDVKALRVALEDALNALSRDDRDTLMIRGFEDISPATYRAVPTPADRPVNALGA